MTRSARTLGRRRGLLRCLGLLAASLDLAPCLEFQPVARSSGLDGAEGRRMRMFDPASSNQEWHRHDRAVTFIVGGLSFGVFALGAALHIAVVFWP